MPSLPLSTVSQAGGRRGRMEVWMPPRSSNPSFGMEVWMPLRSSNPSFGMEVWMPPRSSNPSFGMEVWMPPATLFRSFGMEVWMPLRSSDPLRQGRLPPLFVSAQGPGGHASEMSSSAETSYSVIIAEMSVGRSALNVTESDAVGMSQGTKKCGEAETGTPRRISNASG